MHTAQLLVNISGVGRAVEPKEMYIVATDKNHVFYINNYNELAKIKSVIMREANFSKKYYISCFWHKLHS